MTSQGSGNRSKASEVGASPIQAHPENASANHTPNCEEISASAPYGIYLGERGSHLKAMRLMIGCKPNAR